MQCTWSPGQTTWVGTLFVGIPAKRFEQDIARHFSYVFMNMGALWIFAEVCGSLQKFVDVCGSLWFCA